MTPRCAHCARDRTDIDSPFFQPLTCCTFTFVPSLPAPEPLPEQEWWRVFGAAMRLIHSR